MGRPRGFDEAQVIREAVTLFAGRPYDGVSVDDLVAQLGVHRNSLYKTFGSKRGLYLAALRWHLAHEVAPVIERVSAGAPDSLDTGTGLDLLLLAAVERAPIDAEVAAEVTAVLDELDRALGGAEHTATVLGRRLRARIPEHPQE